MTNFIEAPSTCDLAKFNLNNILNHGVKVKRDVGGWCLKQDKSENVLETYGITFKLSDPKRCITSQHCLAAEIETEDYLLGLNPGFVHHSPWSFYSKWLMNENVYPYTYGERGGKFIDVIIQLLKDEPTTRHAVINIWDKFYDLNKQLSHNFVPCGTQWIFSINDGKLDMFATIRSQDACRGFFLDSFAYPFIQQYIANELKVPLGSYYHILLNSHIYEDDIDFAKRLLDNLIEQHPLRIDWPNKLTSKQKEFMIATSKDLFINHKMHSAKAYVRRLPKFWQSWKENQVVYAYTKYIKNDPSPTALTIVGVVINTLPGVSNE